MNPYHSYHPHPAYVQKQAECDHLEAVRWNARRRLLAAKGASPILQERLYSEYHAANAAYRQAMEEAEQLARLATRYPVYNDTTNDDASTGPEGEPA